MRLGLLPIVTLIKKHGVQNVLTTDSDQMDLLSFLRFSETVSPLVRYRSRPAGDILKVCKNPELSPVFRDCRSLGMGSFLLFATIVPGFSVTDEALGTAEPLPPEIRKVSDIHYKDARPKGLTMDLYLPAADTESSLPILVYVHGGGYRKGSRDEITAIPFYRECLLALVSTEKLAVAAIDFRRGSKKAPFKALIDDCKDAVTWLRKNSTDYQLDSTRIGLLGESSGGLLALMAGLTDPGIAIILANSPVTDLVRSAKAVEESEEEEAKQDRNRMEIGLGGTLEEVPNNYRDASPVYNIQESSPPIFLMVGCEDPLLKQAVWLKEAGDEVGAKIEIFIVDNAGNRVFDDFPERSPSLTEIMASVQKFILMHLGPSDPADST